MPERKGKTATALERFQQRREATAREILEAARRVIAFNGFHNTKIADIARAANVGVGTFYLYYPTKQAMFLELVEDSGRKLAAQLESLRARVTEPAQLARQSTEVFLRFAQDNRELFKIVFGHGAGFHEVVRRAQDMFVRDTIDNLEAGMRAGVFRSNRADVVAQAMIGMTLQVVSWWLENESVPIEEISEALVATLFHGIAADPAREGGGAKGS
jgi:AcrR family transcriptional regulator